MAKTAAAVKAATPPAAEEKAPERDYDEITYFPGEGDPVRTSWNGLNFVAHIPTKVSKQHTVLVPMPIEVTMPDGTIQTRHVEKRIKMSELAKNNPSFMVNGAQAAKPAPKAVRLPDSPDTYRGYALRWIADTRELSALNVRWEAEQALRDRCGVNDGDIAYIMPFFEAKREGLDIAAFQNTR